MELDKRIARVGVLVTALLWQAATPTSVSAQDADLQGLVIRAIHRGLSENHINHDRLIRPVFVDTSTVNTFLRKRGSPSLDPVLLRRSLPRVTIVLTASYDEVVVRGPVNDPRYLQVIRGRQESIGKEIVIAPHQVRHNATWIKDDGVYVSLREFDHADPTRDNIGVTSPPASNAIRLEVSVRTTSLFYVPTGASPVIEATWTGKIWYLRVLGVKLG